MTETLKVTDGRNSGGAGQGAPEAFVNGEALALLLAGRNLSSRMQPEDAPSAAFWTGLNQPELLRDYDAESRQCRGKKPVVINERTAKFLKEELGATEQYIEGDTVHVKLEKPIQKDFPGAPPIWFGKELTFKIASSSDKIQLTEIKGLMAKPDYCPWLYITNATLERSTSPDTNEEKCTATIRGGRARVYANVSIPIPKTVYHQLEKVVEDNFGH